MGVSRCQEKGVICVQTQGLWTQHELSVDVVGAALALIVTNKRRFNFIMGVTPLSLAPTVSVSSQPRLRPRPEKMDISDLRKLTGVNLSLPQKTTLPQPMQNGRSRIGSWELVVMPEKRQPFYGLPAGCLDPTTMNKLKAVEKKTHAHVSYGLVTIRFKSTNNGGNGSQDLPLIQSGKWGLPGRQSRQVANQGSPNWHIEVEEE
ncbi:hypothetical protein L218DRAFT_1038909 [Marasmius fiardii PR-910]|nr:hypothetical protein L218DRAFT_1038909 [Marasmius fiardii PR-910]